MEILLEWCIKKKNVALAVKVSSTPSRAAQFADFEAILADEGISKDALQGSGDGNKMNGAVQFAGGSNMANDAYDTLVDAELRGGAWLRTMRAFIKAELALRGYVDGIYGDDDVCVDNGTSTTRVRIHRFNQERRALGLEDREITMRTPGGTTFDTFATGEGCAGRMHPHVDGPVSLARTSFVQKHELI